MFKNLNGKLRPKKQLIHNMYSDSRVLIRSVTLFSCDLTSLFTFICRFTVGLGKIALLFCFHLVVRSTLSMKLGWLYFLLKGFSKKVGQFFSNRLLLTPLYDAPDWLSNVHLQVKVACQLIHLLEQCAYPWISWKKAANIKLAAPL